MSDTDVEKNISKVSANLINLFFIYYSTRKVFKDFVYFLEIANLRKNSLLVTTTSIAYATAFQRHFVHNLLSISVVLGRRLEENSFSKSFYKTREVVKEGLPS